MPTGTPAPFTKSQFFTSAGAPAAGYKMFTYSAGTTTKVLTYTDSTLGVGVQNTNPIVLDSAGRCDIWLTPGVAYKFVFALPTDTDPPTSPVWTEDNISAVNPMDSVALSGGLIVGFTGTPTNDQVQVGDANFAMAWSAGTVPRIIFDSGPDDFRYTRATNTFEMVIANTSEMTLDASGMQIADGLNVGFAATPSADTVKVGDANFNLDGSAVAVNAVINFDSGSDQINFVRLSNRWDFKIANTSIATLGSAFGFSGLKGADVVAAAAIVPTGNVFHVTGNTNITSITSTGVAAGTVITLIFDGTPTLTDGGNLKLAGNLVATADDTCTLVFDGASWFETARSIN